MGKEYIKARQLAAQRKWPELVEDSDNGSEAGFHGYESDGSVGVLASEDLQHLRHYKKVPRPPSAPGNFF